MLAVAHRAGNSVAGLRAALAAGVDLVEADVHLRRGLLEVRHGRRPWWRRVVVPELDEILAVAAGDPRLMLDLKGRSLDVASAVAATLRERATDVPVAVCTKEWAMLDAFAGDPGVRRVFSAANAAQLARLRARMRRERVDGVSIRLRLLTPAVVAELRRATDLVLAWSVDTEAELARAVQIGVTGVISKNLPLLRGLRDQPTP
ncbi:glycerophosphodiester phosphodiesterase [Paractinoplanes toevensis]|uniref:glycerophosphodiester phosphodiesterase n=1 Tax=Paractinoplanes toevensis TaxID=571911 RepID=UPI001BB3D589|nr:glycerophosphodiester phosphodiesterase [Actinoplanes toevensis]